MRAGAFDYLEKPFTDPRRVQQTLERALERRRLRVRNRELEGELGRRSALERVVAQSAAMKRVLQTVRDLVAEREQRADRGRERHRQGADRARDPRDLAARRRARSCRSTAARCPRASSRASCSATCAARSRARCATPTGLFRSAHGGTLFLDEIGELPVPLQAKLLRVIQEREVRPLGSATAEPVDVRIIAATNRDLAGEVRANRFRADLFYRLRVVSIHLPPLRERPEDVAVLASHFLERAAAGTRVIGLEPDALERLIAHRWDGQRARAREHDRGRDRARAGRARDGRGPAHGRLQRPARGDARGHRPVARSLRARLSGRGAAPQPGRRARRGEAARHRPQHVLPQARRT